MAGVLVVLLVVVPLTEIYLLLQVGHLLGALPTIALLLGLSVLGGALLRSQGARTWRAFQAALSAGRVPAGEVADGALVLLGGALLLTPGFLTDAVGLLCVLPGPRGLVRRVLLGVVLRRTGAAGLAGTVAARQFRRRPGRPKPRPGVVEGEVVHDGVEEPPSADHRRPSDG